MAPSTRVASLAVAVAMVVAALLLPCKAAPGGSLCQRRPHAMTWKGVERRVADRISELAINYTTVIYSVRQNSAENDTLCSGWMYLCVTYGREEAEDPCNRGGLQATYTRVANNIPSNRGRH